MWHFTSGLQKLADEGNDWYVLEGAYVLRCHILNTKIMGYAQVR